MEPAKESARKRQTSQDKSTRFWAQVCLLTVAASLLCVRVCARVFSSLLCCFLVSAGVDESSLQLRLTVGGHPLVLSCPADSDSLFDIDTDAGALAEWHATVATYCFEQEDVTLPVLLDKMAAVWEKTKPSAPAGASASSGGPAAAAASASSASALSAFSASASAPAPLARAASKMSTDGFDDDDDDDGFGDGGGGADGDAAMEDADGGDWGDFSAADPSAEIQDDACNASKALKKKLLAKAETLRASQAHATEVQKQANALKGVKTIFSSDAAVTMLVNDAMSYMSSPQPGVKVRCVDDSVFVWAVQLSDFPADSQMQKDLLQLQSLFGYKHVELEIRFMMDLYPFFPPSVRLVR